MLVSRLSLLLLLLFAARLAQAASTAADGCVAAVAAMERAQSRLENGNKATFDAFDEEVRQAYEVCRAADGPPDAKATAYKMWAIVGRDRKNAIAALFDGIEELEQRHGKDAPEMLPLLLHLGLMVAGESREEGTALLERAVAIQKQHRGESSEQVAEGYMHLAVVAEGSGDFTLAEHHYRTAIDVARKACGPQCRTLSTAILSLTDIIKRDPRRAAEVAALQREWEEASPREPRRKRKQATE
ncbi:MAG TPA: hypothetical protein VF618_18570 [Thermoanaerobaculia bacterium]